MENNKRFKVEHRSAKWNCANGHGTGLFVVENPAQPKVISQERLAEIKALQIQSTDAREIVENIEERLGRKIKSVRDDLKKGLPVEKGPFEAHME